MSADRVPWALSACVLSLVVAACGSGKAALSPSSSETPTIRQTVAQSNPRSAPEMLTRINSKTPFAQFEHETAASILQQLKMLVDYTTIYGGNKRTIEESIAAYTYLVAEFGNKPSLLHALAHAQKEMYSITDGPVQALTQAGQNASTLKASVSDDSKAIRLGHFEVGYTRAMSAAAQRLRLPAQ